MVGVGRDLCGSSSPTLLPKQGHLELAAQDLVQVGLEYLQRRRTPSKPRSFLEAWVQDVVTQPHNQYLVLTVDFESPEP